MSPVAKTTALAGNALREPTRRNARHAALFERVAERIYGYFVKNVWDRDEADDLAQRTLLELERSLRERTYDPARSFNAWMWIKAHDQLVRYYRERARRPGSLPDSVDAGDADGAGATPAECPAAHEGDVDARLDAETLLREIQRRLGQETYEVFVLYHESGLRQVEVAEAVGRDRKTVVTRLRAANELLERLLAAAERPGGTRRTKAGSIRELGGDPS